jgi:hypothetical protein
MIRALLAVVLALTIAACGNNNRELPYQDKESTARLALFDAAGHPVAKGNVNDRPFVAFAVSDQKAPPPYDNTGRKAALLAFQPREGVDPGKWGGDFLTASTSYTDTKRPTAHGTAEDISLANFIAEFPPQWNGLIQLRMYLGVPEHPGLTERYATTEIRVSGETWSLVGDAPSIAGGPASTEPAGSPR